MLDISNLILSISIPVLLSIFGTIISYQNYKLKKKQDNSVDVEKEKEKEARLVHMEADIAYIRQVVDGTQGKINALENKINEVENRSIRTEEDVKSLLKDRH